MSIFNEPEAHNIIGMSAKTKVCQGNLSNPFSVLTLQLKAQAEWESQPCAGEFRIYGDADMADKFTRLATAINEIFAPEPVRAAADVHVSEDA